MLGEGLPGQLHGPRVRGELPQQAVNLRLDAGMPERCISELVNHPAQMPFTLYSPVDSLCHAAVPEHKVDALLDDDGDVVARQL